MKATKGSVVLLETLGPSLPNEIIWIETGKTAKRFKALDSINQPEPMYPDVNVR